MKNILLVGNWSSDTGFAWWLMETFWIAIARKYSGRGRVFVCYPKVTTVSPQLRAENIEVIEFEVDEKNPRAIFRMVKEYGIDTVYLTDRRYIGPLFFWLRASGVKHIILHDHTPGQRSRPVGLKHLAKRLVSQISAFTADAYIAVSDQVYERLLKVACLPPHKCHLAKNGIDIDKFSLAHPAKVREEIRAPVDAVLVVSSGRLTHYKGIQTIIEAAAFLIHKQHVENIFFVHAGDGPEREQFDNLIKDHSLTDRFFLLGMRKDVPEILKAADIAVHASHGEGLSLSVLEFMGAGLPVVVSDDPTVCQSVADGVSGLYFKVKDASDLADKISHLASSSLLREKLGDNAFREVAEKYSLGQTVDSLLRVFSKVVD